MDTSMKASAAKMDNNPPKLVIKKMSVLDKFKLKNVGIVQALQRAVAKSSDASAQKGTTEGNVLLKNKKVVSTSTNTTPKNVVRNNKIQIISNIALPKKDLTPKIVPSMVTATFSINDIKGNTSQHVRTMLSEKIKKRQQEMLTKSSKSIQIQHAQLQEEPEIQFLSSNYSKQINSFPVPIISSNSPNVLNGGVDNIFVQKSPVNENSNTVIYNLDSNTNELTHSNIILEIPPMDIKNELNAVQSKHYLEDGIFVEMAGDTFQNFSYPVIDGNTNELVSHENSTSEYILPESVNLLFERQDIENAPIFVENKPLFNITQSEDISEVPAPDVQQNNIYSSIPPIEISVTQKQTPTTLAPHLDTAMNLIHSKSIVVRRPNSEKVSVKVHQMGKSLNDIPQRFQKSSKIISDIYSSISTSKLATSTIPGNSTSKRSPRPKTIEKISPVQPRSKASSSAIEIIEDIKIKPARRNRRKNFIETPPNPNCHFITEIGRDFDKSSELFVFGKHLHSDETLRILAKEAKKVIGKGNPNVSTFRLLDEANNFLGYDRKSIDICKKKTNAKIKIYESLLKLERNKEKNLLQKTKEKRISKQQIKSVETSKSSATITQSITNETLLSILSDDKRDVTNKQQSNISMESEENEIQLSVSINDECQIVESLNRECNNEKEIVAEINNYNESFDIQTGMIIEQTKPNNSNVNEKENDSIILQTSTLKSSEIIDLEDSTSTQSDVIPRKAPQKLRKLKIKKIEKPNLKKKRKKRNKKDFEKEKDKMLEFLLKFMDKDTLIAEVLKKENKKEVNVQSASEDTNDSANDPEVVVATNLDESDYPIPIQEEVIVVEGEEIVDEYYEFEDNFADSDNYPIEIATVVQNTNTNITNDSKNNIEEGSVEIVSDSQIYDDMQCPPIEYNTQINDKIHDTINLDTSQMVDQIEENTSDTKCDIVDGNYPVELQNNLEKVREDYESRNSFDIEDNKAVIPQQLPTEIIDSKCNTNLNDLNDTHTSINLDGLNCPIVEQIPVMISDKGKNKSKKRTKITTIENSKIWNKYLNKNLNTKNNDVAIEKFGRKENSRTRIDVIANIDTSTPKSVGHKRRRDDSNTPKQGVSIEQSNTDLSNYRIPKIRKSAQNSLPEISSVSNENTNIAKSRKRKNNSLNSSPQDEKDADDVPLAIYKIPKITKSSRISNVGESQNNYDRTEEKKGAKSKKPETVEVTPSTPKKRGPKSKFNSSDSVVDITNSNAAEVICGNCKETVQIRDWRSHVIFHNGLTWKEGEEEKIDLHDHKMILRKMLWYMRTYKQTVLTCPKCKNEKKSALGIISHMESCGLTEEEIENAKVECPHCSVRIRSVSLPIHIAHHCPALREQVSIKRNQEKQLNNSEGTEVEFNDSGRIKRNAVKKAERLLKNITNAEIQVEEYVNIVRKQSLMGGVVMKWKKQIKVDGTAKCIFERCTYHVNNIPDLRAHHYECEFSIKEGFSCSLCKFENTNRDVIEDHIKKTHMDDISRKNLNLNSDSEASMGIESSESEPESGDDEIGSNNSPVEEDEYEKKSNLGRGRKIVLFNTSSFKENDNFRLMSVVYYDKLKVYKKSNLFSTHVCIPKTMKFRCDNFSLETLFEDLIYTNRMEFLTIKVGKSYLPREWKSIKYVTHKTATYVGGISDTKLQDSEWTELDLFESRRDSEDNFTIYCGGPVTAMKWIPLPDDYDGPQYIAIACNQNFNDGIKIIDGTHQKCLIQIWRINQFDLNLEEKPVLMYSIAYDYGPILQLDFCPSGGYAIEQQRLGLLAVTSIIGDINILSLPMRLDQGIIIKLEPSMVLKIDSDNTNNGYTTRVCWSQYKKHNLIAAGYSRGLSAVWNLNSKSSLLKYRIGSQNILLPTQIINNPSSSTTAIAFHDRFLMVSSIDRKTKVYDLESLLTPKEVSSFVEKSRVSCGEWSTLWSSYFLGFDQGYALGRTGITLMNPLHIGIKSQTLVKTPSTLCDLSSNDWTGSCIGVSENGDIYSFIPQQLFYNIMDKEGNKLRCLLGYTDYIKMDPDNVLNDNDCKVLTKDFGIVFCDMNEKNRTFDVLKIKQYRDTDLKKYPINKINRVSLNGNMNYSKYYALGYQSGFVRIKYLNFT